MKHGLDNAKALAALLLNATVLGGGESVVRGQVPFNQVRLGPPVATPTRSSFGRGRGVGPGSCNGRTSWPGSRSKYDGSGNLIKKP